MAEIKNEIVDSESKGLKEESIKDYASRRLVELRNYEQQMIGQHTKMQNSVAQLNSEIIATRGIIGEMMRIIGDEDQIPPEKP